MLSESELAFIALHKDCYPPVYKYVRRRVRDAEVAEELAADVFRVAWQKWNEASALGLPWLFIVARNLLGNSYRSDERHRALHEKLQATAPALADDGDGDSVVEDAMSALRPTDREILELAYWDELSLVEIAAVLQCRESTAKVRLHRAREAFRKQLPARTQSVVQKMGA